MFFKAVVSADVSYMLKLVAFERQVPAMDHFERNQKYSNIAKFA